MTTNATTGRDECQVTEGTYLVRGILNGKRFERRVKAFTEYQAITRCEIVYPEVSWGSAVRKRQAS